MTTARSAAATGDASAPVPRPSTPEHAAFGRRATPPGTAPSRTRLRDTHEDGGPHRPSPSPEAAPTDRCRGWITTLVITAIAGVTRFVTLGNPTDSGTPVFDEKHYAPQAWQMLGGGWIEDNPGYELVVHPPLAKQLMALGQWMFGYDGFGWRFASAVAGTVLVLLIIRIARRMTGSTMLGAVAGLLGTADGVLTVSSRTALLDIFLTVFMVAAFACLLRDREQVLDRMSLVAAEGRIHDSAFGPRLGFRWWRFGAGVLLGLSCAAKWGGLYYVAFFGLLCVMSDVAARRRFGVRRPWAGALVRDTPAALASLVLVPLLTYLGSWWAWFASEVGVDRHAVGWKIGTGGDFAFVPDALRSLWYYSAHVLEFHEHLTNSAGNRHPWESKPWTWPMSLRPLLYYFADGDKVTGCGSDKCVSAMMIVGTPAMWWLSLPVAAWAVWRIATRRDWRYTWILVGYAAGYLPWFLNLDRQMYFFYSVGLAPFLILAITLVLGEILGTRRPHPPPHPTGPAPAPPAPDPRAYRPGERRRLGLAIVCGYVALVIANYVWLWPILTGGTISEAHWQMELWLPSWR
ncbi:dolichyl-phosphate-mannose--protein mannosyltransferase [Tomitella gaofuii]|uniref:dolichyl-phosphate-mannose--protein mannosyltransferase n=1 Tax=Tomitella gaofuii TaxID=2760083 RepID=UPI0015FA50B0|nr:phospholipid carrier-dependent glycosyltransferase [Tomitella gaofuii]